MANVYKLDNIKTENAFNYKYLLKRIFPYIKPLMFRIVVAFFLAVPLGLLDGATAFALKPYIDVVVNGDTLTYFDYTLTRDFLSKIIPPAIVIFAGVQGVLKYLNTYLADWISYTIANSVKIDLYKKLVYMDSKFYDANSSGLVISRFLTDPDHASKQLVNTLKALITAFTGAFGLICVLLYNSWQLAFVGVAVLTTTFVPMAMLRKRIKKVSNKTTVVGGDITTTFNETYSGNKVISGYNLQENEFQRIKKLIRETFSLQMSLTKRAGWLSPFMYIIASFGIAFVMFYGNTLIEKGMLSTGSFASFITSLLLLYKPIKTIGHDLTTIQTIFVSLNRVFELFDLEPEIKDDKTKKLDFVPNVIEFKDTSFSYEKGKEVLHKINLKVNKGETVALVGNSGGGKSTIVNLLPRFYDIDSGNILFDGIDIREFSLSSLRNSISQVFQDNFLFSGTIRQNIMLANPNATDEQLQYVIKAAHLDEFVSTLENGLDTIVAENGVSLSGGQKQRVAIARAMIKNSPIIVLDEATSALDNKSEKVVQRALDNLIKDKTVFVIAHRLSTIVNADKIVVINEGNIVETGRHEELLNIPNGAYLNLYNMQFANK